MKSTHIVNRNVRITNNEHKARDYVYDLGNTFNTVIVLKSYNYIAYYHNDTEPDVIKQMDITSDKILYIIIPYKSRNYEYDTVFVTDSWCKCGKCGSEYNLIT